MNACPTCATPRNQGDSACPNCGFVFGSEPAVPVSALPAPMPGPLQAAPTSDLLLQPGQKVHQERYTIFQPLSRGGMGALYLAHDHSAFDRLVVVKVLLPATDAQTTTEASQQRFLDEARMLASLKHPTIPQIFAYFQDGPHTCIVMEYVEGRDLERGLTRVDEATGVLEPGAPYALADVLRWGILVCRMLEYLANRLPPVIHQDIKPANLVLDTSTDGLFLVDFGTASGRQTTGDGAYGTPGYAPPEQYKGQAEPRSDVYALAATLYHLATDDDPRQHRFQFPRLAQLGNLGEALSAALRDDVAQRPTARELRQRLEGLTTTKPAPAPTSTPLRAPDSTQLHDIAELAYWCENHWDQARIWLYGKLPDQVELLWGNTHVAKWMRDIVQNYGPNTALALDKLLVLLDPQGYGAAQPQLDTNPFVLDLGDLAPNEHRPAQVLVTNTGRRYVKVGLRVPSAAWLRVHEEGLALGPGQHATLNIEIDLSKTYPLPEYLSRTITFEQEGEVLTRLDVQANVVQTRVQPRSAAPLSTSSISVGALAPTRAGQAQPGQAATLSSASAVSPLSSTQTPLHKRWLIITTSIIILLVAGLALVWVLSMIVGTVALVIYVGVVVLGALIAGIKLWTTGSLSLW